MRGTTPTIIIKTDLDLSEADVIYVTFQQQGKTILEKEKNNLSVTENSVEVELTQEETLNFDESTYLEFQIRARFADGTAVKSNTMKTTVTKILKDGEI